MGIQFSTTSSGPWDEKYPHGSPGPPSTSSNEPILYPDNPRGTYIMKLLSHSWTDVSEMIAHCVRSSSQDIKYHPICALLCRSINYNQDLGIILAQYMNIYNHLFFGRMVKSSAMDDSADNEVKIIFSQELVTDELQAEEVELNDYLGLIKSSFEDGFNRVTIYILDTRSVRPGWSYHEIIREMLGTLAHEMIHAVHFMYTKYTGIRYATHGTNFQRAAQAIEQANRVSSGGERWSTRKSNLVEILRYYSTFCIKNTRNRLTQRFETWG
ncbi:uncharacterized protein EAE97_006866 [Botrytis byssoidea]|uniref:SprT-like domain-containing protein n=1 Tax=Botrytis byssoidea TaxID=139641 RepID=A0A9P5IH23_9HELO|nr:uncharacterized protein EAE97_006866 [Botrytis byssoidea]KAF7940680.1 hypothetical protein EAE97_006866 [Botrytis byssoidea]